MADSSEGVRPTTETTEPGRYVTLDVEVSGDLEARWVLDVESDTTGLLLRHIA
jgi:hypothetical protein